jgi:hypothetical protein
VSQRNTYAGTASIISYAKKLCAKRTHRGILWKKTTLNTGAGREPATVSVSAPCLNITNKGTGKTSSNGYLTKRKGKKQKQNKKTKFTHKHQLLPAEKPKRKSHPHTHNVVKCHSYPQGGHGEPPLHSPHHRRFFLHFFATND